MYTKTTQPILTKVSEIVLKYILGKPKVIKNLPV